MKCNTKDINLEDTLSTKIKKDIVLTTKDTLKRNDSERNITTEITTYKGQNDCWFNFCDCKLLSDLLWPLTILVILSVFKKQFQRIVDSISERIKKGAKVKLTRDGIEIGQELSETEQKEKAEEEYKTTIKKATVEQNEPTIAVTDFVPKYLSLERRIFEALLKALYPRYRILSNRRIGLYEYDLIIDTLDNKDFDYIIEVKYYPNNEFTKMQLQEIALKLSFMKQEYKSVLSRSAKPALIIVTNKDFDFETEMELLKHVNEPFREKGYVKLLMINQNEIENLSKNVIIRFLED